ncbi:MAG: hypothetical protein ACI4GZ_02185 [Ruminococcus sp.]
MLTILPCEDADRLSQYPENTTLLIYKEEGQERGHIAYRPYKSTIEILSLGLTGSEGENTRDEKFLRADGLIRSLGAIALNSGVITLSTKDTTDLDILLDLGFFKNGDYYTIFLNKLFTGVCKGCCGGECKD